MGMKRNSRVEPKGLAYKIEFKNEMTSDARYRKVRMRKTISAEGVIYV